MRILLVIGSLRAGGAEGQILHLASGLKSLGHSVAIMLLRHEGEHLGRAHELNIPILRADVPEFRDGIGFWLKLPAALIRSRRLLNTFRPDVVHAHLFWAHLWAWILFLVPGLRIPLITSRLQVWRRATKPALHQVAENLINRRASMVIANSNFVAKSCRHHERHLSGKIIVVLNGIDTAHFDASEDADLRQTFPDLRGASTIAINVANLLPLKGHTDLLRAWSLVITAYPHAKLLCVGADCGMLARLVAQRNTLNLQSHVAFAGAQPHVAPLIKGCDLAIQASLDEGMSVALLEYMGCRKAVVATDVGGTREAFSSPPAGVLVPARNYASLAKAIIQLLGAPEERVTLGAAAHAHVAKNFSLEKYVQAHLRAYRRVIRTH